ncbi:hypothetical protein [Luteipulveratus halotolerans]|uniref:Uncharacterized protein n=1 Tax=Luteipulveratus halotolerans TaxID=1631356 RepID=A0A0L6CEN1_9MICO|nr:hypothetical protein [Luteipulveratus halotolerans]KNX36144.1 hypothetical protein VV01_01635 [Luteipulveratus halotolerans]
MLIESGDVRILGVTPARARVTFSSGADDGPRALRLDGDAAYELSHWCGTCPLLFQRQSGAASTTSLERLADLLTDGIGEIDEDVVAAYATLLERGRYLPLLLQVRPRMVRPTDADDYFSHEQVSTWGIDPFWGLPESPRVAYYRTWESEVAGDAHLYEFVVPMVAPTQNDRARVAELRAALRPTMTAVAVSTLDVCEPALDLHDDYYAHWGLTHFLLDGHHKMEAAAEAGEPIQLLSLVNLDASLAVPEQISRLVDVRNRPAARRTAGRS